MDENENHIVFFVFNTSRLSKNSGSRLSWQNCWWVNCTNCTWAVAFGFIWPLPHKSYTTHGSHHFAMFFRPRCFKYSSKSYKNRWAIDPGKECLLESDGALRCQRMSKYATKVNSRSQGQDQNLTAWDGNSGRQSFMVWISRCGTSKTGTSKATSTGRTSLSEDMGWLQGQWDASLSCFSQLTATSSLKHLLLGIHEHCPNSIVFARADQDDWLRIIYTPTESSGHNNGLNGFRLNI